MTVFDLVFLVSALTGIAGLAAALVAALRGRATTARRILGRLGVGALVYFTILVAVSLLSPGRTLAVGQELCSDDWCMAVTKVGRNPARAHDAYDVVFRLRSRARRVTQRERGVLVYLRDAAGRRIDALPAGDQPPFDAALGPGDSVGTTRRFELPGDEVPREVVLTRAGLPFPGCVIIGDADSFLHWKTTVRIP